MFCVLFSHLDVFTELLRIPYFDTVRFTVVDPMHNAFLGTAKRMVGIWKSSNLIPDVEFDSIQVAVNNFTTPADIGRIPHKISSQFSSFTVDQWKNWTLIYSPVVLKSVLPRNHYECWCIFVDICQFLCSRAVSLSNVEKMDELIIRFCKTFEDLYGSQFCTPNLHLHCECMLDYGPAGSFWAFPFERLNGMLGSVPTNHQAIEAQLMRKFYTTQGVIQTLKSSDAVLCELFQSHLGTKGSLKYEEIPELPLSSLFDSFENRSCRLVPPVKEACFSEADHELADHTLKAYFGDKYIKILLLHRYSRAVYFGGHLYGSLNSIHSNSALVYAKIDTCDTCRPCFVKKYYEGHRSSFK